jgi:hypothetical protein
MILCRLRFSQKPTKLLSGVLPTIQKDRNPDGNFVCFGQKRCLLKIIPVFIDLPQETLSDFISILGTIFDTKPLI